MNLKVRQELILVSKKSDKRIKELLSISVVNPYPCANTYVL